MRWARSTAQDNVQLLRAFIPMRAGAVLPIDSPGGGANLDLQFQGGTTAAHSAAFSLQLLHAPPVPLTVSRKRQPNVSQLPGCAVAPPDVRSAHATVLDAAHWSGVRHSERCVNSHAVALYRRRARDDHEHAARLTPSAIAHGHDKSPRTTSVTR